MPINSNVIFIAIAVTIAIVLMLVYVIYTKTKQQLVGALNLLTENCNHINTIMLQNNANLQQTVIDRLHQLSLESITANNALKTTVRDQFAESRTILEQNKLSNLKMIQESLLQGLTETRNQVKYSLTEYAEQVNQRISYLSETTAANLKTINQQVTQSLSSGFAKTNETFINIVERLTLIDAAQKQIAELSINVVDLQAILTDKRSRGAFGEIQLAGLVKNILPNQYFSLQHQLSTNKRPDCVLFLPEPIGSIAIDAKFPLESFRLLIDHKVSSTEKKALEQQFRQDIKRHIQDITEKYIIPGETADSAIMFIPAEAIFAEIHNNYIDLVEMAQRAKVWITSPTTLMAILTTARAVIKDADTTKQLHIIQRHLNLLAKDFVRFQERMNNVAKHIDQAHQDVQQVHTSAQKISQRFNAIEKVELLSEKEITLL